MKTSNLKIPWQDMLLSIYSAGFSWTGLSRRLGCDERTVGKYAHGEETALKVTYERAVVIIELYAVLYREHYELVIRPLLRLPGDRIPIDEAVRNLVRSTP